MSLETVSIVIYLAPPDSIGDNINGKTVGIIVAVCAVVVIMIAVPIALLGNAANEVSKQQNEKYNAEFKVLDIETGLSQYKYTDTWTTQSFDSLNYVKASAGNALMVYKVKATNLGTQGISPYYGDFQITDNTSGIIYQAQYESSSCTNMNTGYNSSTMTIAQNGSATLYLIFDVPLDHSFTLGFSNYVYSYENWKWVE